MCTSSADESHSISKLLRDKSWFTASHDDDEGIESAAPSFMKFTNDP